MKWFLSNFAGGRVVLTRVCLCMFLYFSYGFSLTKSHTLWPHCFVFSDLLCLVFSWFSFLWFSNLCFLNLVCFVKFPRSVFLTRSQTGSHLMICFGFSICFSHSGFPTQNSHTNFSASNEFDAGKNPTRFFVFSCRMPSRALAFGRKDGMDRRSRSWILIAERFTVTQGIRERSSGRFEDKDTGTVSAVRAEASAHGRRTRMGVTRGVGYADHHNRKAVVMSPPLMPFLFSG